MGREARRSSPEMKLVLNAGCGVAHADDLHPMFARTMWQQTRLDVDPALKPDLVASIVDMTQVVPDAAFDAIWCSHNLEHLRSFEVPLALAEFRRALKPSGFAFVTCPDLDEVARLIVDDGLDAVAYVSPAGPIAAIDMLYGHRGMIEAGRDYMAHRTGFTLERLGTTLNDAGFDDVIVGQGSIYDLWALALMPDADLDAIRAGLEPTAQAWLVAEAEDEDFDEADPPADTRLQGRHSRA